MDVDGKGEIVEMGMEMEVSDTDVREGVDVVEVVMDDVVVDCDCINLFRMSSLRI